MLMFPITAICYMSCVWIGLYKPKRTRDIVSQMFDIFKAATLSILLILAMLYYIQSHPYSRKLLFMFYLMLIAGLGLSHALVMIALRYCRAKGYNLRHYAVIGAGKKGQQLVRDLERADWFGLKCSCFIDNNPDRIGRELNGIPVLGPIEKVVDDIVESGGIDEVYLAQGGAEAQSAYSHMERLQAKGITIRIIPDWGNLVSISTAEVITVGSQLLFSSDDSPLNSLNIIIKEIFDRIVALILLIFLSVPFLIIAILVKATSRGPVFYLQTRIGAGQKEFQMIKFRTMVHNAEEENGPQWARQDDPRRTKIGVWLRRTSLDEIPQLINVIKGDMSLVGPRPERPFFVKQFSEEYKKYMLRHKVKAGITGWAQVKGFRGNCDLRKRLQYDLYYVRNWSFWLDLRILLMTPWHVFRGRNAY